MNRRSYLQSLAVTATAISPVLAGCNETDTTGGDNGGGSGDGGGDSSDDGDGSGNEKATETATATPEELAEGHIKEAVGSLNKVGFKLQELETQIEEDPANVEFDIEATRGVLESARSELDAAAETATAEQEQDIQALRHLATIVASMANAIETIRGTNPNARLEEIQTVIANENYEQALEMLRESRSTMQQTATELEAGLSAADAVDPERLQALNAAELSQVRPPLEAMHTVVEGFSTLATGFEEMLLGREDLAEAQTHLDNQEVSAAKEDIQKANTHFTDAKTTFDGVSSDATVDISTHLERARCQADHLVKATEHLEKAAEAYENGDPVTAQQERDAAEAELEKVNDC
ncbi:hypothetical protein [Haloarchaeobius sp. HME9146]|uniref:hypothetical protein n=1 Tax=Haloarchaeobius sp. HME9146 TaxID=2978732 RepID=UPI0021C038C8|nr:hypothetical protein [Haloarchaeobius sp. HME9146]MCT9094955.1 hypothetical protein [Haloarchaeobius sp. HME9146]